MVDFGNPNKGALDPFFARKDRCCPSEKTKRKLSLEYEHSEVKYFTNEEKEKYKDQQAERINSLLKSQIDEITKIIALVNKNKSEIEIEQLTNIHICRIMECLKERKTILELKKQKKTEDEIEQLTKIPLRNIIEYLK